MRYLYFLQMKTLIHFTRLVHYQNGIKIILILKIFQRPRVGQFSKCSFARHFLELIIFIVEGFQPNHFPGSVIYTVLYLETSLIYVVNLLHFQVE